jgi:RNA polymerase sigma factor (sigma-70 family)
VSTRQNTSDDAAKKRDVTVTDTDTDTDTDQQLEDLVRRLRPRLVAQAALVLGDRSAAEDVVQEALWEVASRSGSIVDVDRYARRAVHNRALNEVRRRARERRAMQQSAQQEEDHRDLVDPLDVSLAERFATLSPTQRSCALLCWGEGLNASEAGAIVGCSAATVRVHLHRARRTLRTALSRPAPTEPR